MRRWLGKIKAFFQEAGSFALPSAVGATGLVLSALFGPHLSLTLFILLGSWLSLKGVLWWGPDLQEMGADSGRRFGPKAMVWGSMILVVLLALGLLYWNWFHSPVSLGVKLLQTIYSLAMSAGSLSCARQVLTGERKDISQVEEVLEKVAPLAEEALQSKVKSRPRERLSASETESGHLSEETAARVLRAAQRCQGPFTPADIASQARLSEEKVEMALDRLYVEGKVDLEINDRTGILYRLLGTAPRMSGEETTESEKEIDLGPSDRRPS